MHPPKTWGRRSRALITRALTGAILEWRGVVIHRWLLRADHGFEITPEPAGGSHLRQFERFEGVLCLLFRRRLDRNLREGFALHDRALKERLESARNGAPPGTLGQRPS